MNEALIWLAGFVIGAWVRPLIDALWNSLVAIHRNAGSRSQ
jgi:hypothetical protein